MSKTARKASTTRTSPQDAPSTIVKATDALREFSRHTLSDRPITLKQRLDYWHKACALVTGAISLSYSGKGISRRVLCEWRDLLRATADDIDKVVNVNNTPAD
jgi:hypothetical protein